MEKMNDYLDACEGAARAGGQVLLDWVGRFAAREKGPSDLVTEADLASQEVIRGILQSSFPLHAFVGEEGEAKGPANAEFCWYVDPLDGTTNYVHQIPHYCVSIALAQRDELLCGTVFDPISQECFTAKQGGGAFLNGKKIRVSDVKEIQSAVAAASFPPRLRPESRELKELSRVMVAAQAVRRTGSAALNLCYLAAGRFDAYWGGVTKPWDIAAGVLMILEASGALSNSDGGRVQMDGGRLVAAATGELHRQMLNLVGDDTAR
jgi:myo-inositol-1(or 4)-monophosphatase